MWLAHLPTSQKHPCVFLLCLYADGAKKSWQVANQLPRSSGVIAGFKLHMGVSENRGTPKSSILIGFSIINHPFWGTYPNFRKHPYRTWLYILSLQTLTDHLQNSSDTVDRRNPAPVDMENLPLCTGFLCISGGAGFLASTVSQQLMEKSTIHPKKQDVEIGTCYDFLSELSMDKYEYVRK